MIYYFFVGRVRGQVFIFLMIQCTPRYHQRLIELMATLAFWGVARAKNKLMLGDRSLEIEQ
jgi:hypothetical protein